MRRIDDENPENAIDAIELIQIFAFLHFEQIPATMFERAWKNIQARPEMLPPEHIISKIFEEGAKLSILTNLIRNSFATWIDSRLRQLPRTLNGSENTWDSFRFREALAVLEQHSLIYRDAGNEETYSMHPLVHSWAQDRLNVQQQIIWSDIALNTIASYITSDFDPEQHLYRISLIPHITAGSNRKHSRTLLKGMGTSYKISKALELAAAYSEGGAWKMHVSCRSGSLKY